jgi:hypothetical protein
LKIIQEDEMQQISAAWLAGYPVIFLLAFFFGACFKNEPKEEGHIKVGNEWMSLAEYRRRYSKEGRH